MLNKFKLLDAFSSAFLLSLIGSAFITNADTRWNIVTFGLITAIVQGLNGLRKQLSNPNKPHLTDFEVKEVQK